MKQFLEGQRQVGHLRLEYFITNAVPQLKMFKYEVYRNLSILEKEGKVIFYNYNYNGRSNEGLVTDSYRSKIESSLGPIDNVLEGYMSESKIENCYNQYIT